MQKYKTKCKYVTNGLYLILLETLFCQYLNLDAVIIWELSFYWITVIMSCLKRKQNKHFAVNINILIQGARVRHLLLATTRFSQLRHTKYSVLLQSIRRRECIYNTDGARNVLITAFTRSFLSTVYRWTFIARTLAYAQICAFGQSYLSITQAVTQIQNFPSHNVQSKGE